VVPSLQQAQASKLASKQSQAMPTALPSNCKLVTDPTMSDILPPVTNEDASDQKLTDTEASGSTSPLTTTQRKPFDNQFLRAVTLDHILVTDGVMQSIGGFSIELYKSKDLRTICSALHVRGVKNAQKVQMVQRLTECKHAKMGISAEVKVKAPFSITAEAESRKRMREEKQEVRHQLDLFKKREEHEEKMKRMTQEKMKFDLQLTLIDSYTKLQKCIIKSLTCEESTTAASIFQPDVGKLTDLKDKIMNQLVQMPDEAEEVRIFREEEMNRNSKKPDNTCNSAAPAAGDDEVDSE